jgi:hypothetical protein
VLHFGRSRLSSCGVWSIPWLGLWYNITFDAVTDNTVVGSLQYISSAGGHGISASRSVYLEIWACVFISLDAATTNIAILVRQKRDDAKDDDDDDNAPTQTSRPGGDGAAVEEESSSDNLSQLSDYGGDSLAMTNNFFPNLSITNRLKYYTFFLSID